LPLFFLTEDSVCPYFALPSCDKKLRPKNKCFGNRKKEKRPQYPCLLPIVLYSPHPFLSVRPGGRQQGSWAADVELLGGQRADPATRGDGKRRAGGAAPWHGARQAARGCSGQRASSAAVHPDRWEFAYESFLRGQTYLLPRIVRGKKRGERGGGGACSASSSDAQAQYAAAAGCCISMGGEDHHHPEEGGPDENKEAPALLEEVQRLRQEQTAIGEELAQMSQRLQATERQPDQLMSFLARLAEDPDGVTRSLVEQAAEKKRRRMQLASQPVRPLPPAPPVPVPVPVLHHQPLLAALEGAAAKGLNGWQWEWAAEQKPSPVVLPTFDFDPPAATYCGAGVQHVPNLGLGSGNSGGIIGMGLTADETAPFPFCLLGQGGLLFF